MMSHKLRLINKNQWGFTMVELMVAIAVTGIISSGITMTFFQVVTGSARASNHMTALTQVRNAGYWVSHDAQLAQSIEVDADPTGFPLVLGWTGWDNVEHEVTYSLEDMAGGLKQIKQSHVINDGDPTEAIVARCISSIEVIPNPYTGGALTLTITVTVGAGSEQQIETKVYRIVPRPGL